MNDQHRSTNEMMRIALEKALAGSQQIVAPRLTAPRLEPQVETETFLSGIDRQAIEDELERMRRK